MRKIIWILVNCNSDREAKTIGTKILNKRLGACFDILERKYTSYFWPPKSGKIESGQGSLLVIETLESKYPDVKRIVEELHSDELPFIGFLELKGAGKEFADWMEGEISKE